MLSDKKLINQNTVNSFREKKLLLAGVVIAFFATCYPILNQLFKSWIESEDNSHGLFIIPISLYLAWQKKECFSTDDIKPTWLGGVLTLLSLVVCLISYHAHVKTISYLSIILIVTSITLFIFGWKFLRCLAFPFLFLLFMIPFPSQIYSSLTIPLQLIVSKISVGLSFTIGVPVFAEGNVIYLPDKILEVVEACSGLRSMMSLLALSVLFGYLAFQSKLLRVALFFSVIPIAIAVNVLRILLIITVLYYFNFNLTTGLMHSFLGITVFMIAFILLFYEKEFLKQWDN